MLRVTPGLSVALACTAEHLPSSDGNPGGGHLELPFSLSRLTWSFDCKYSSAFLLCQHLSLDFVLDLSPGLGRQPVGKVFAIPAWGPDLIPRAYIKKSQMWLCGCCRKKEKPLGGASWCILFKGATALRSFSKPWGQPQVQSSICFPAARPI